MPGIEFSTLTAQELRSLHEALRRRDQAALADEVAAELATRSAHAPRWGGGALRSPEGSAIVESEPADVTPRRSLTVVLGASAAAVLALGLGWSLTRAPSAPAPAPAVLPVVVTQPAPPAPPPAATTLVPTPPAPQRSASDTGPPPSPRPAPAPRLPTARAALPPPLPPAPPARIVVEALAPPAPVSQEGRLRRAYERALAAGADPLAVDRGQARWRKRLERAPSETRRAMLYEQRIRELERTARWGGG